MKNFIKTIIFIIILIGILMVLNKLFSPIGTYEGSWYSAGAMQDMYLQPKNTIDVLYVGDSNVYSGISPLEIYDRIGITGFSASTPQQDVIGSYYIAKEFLKTQHPKAVMLDTSEFFTNAHEFTELGIRSEIDFMKWSKNKLDAINDEDLKLSKDEKLTYLMPILKFHTRYTKLTEFDIRKMYRKSEISYKGYLYDKGVKKYERKRKRSKTEKDEQEDLTTNSNKLDIPYYITKKVTLLKEYCKNNDSELVLISMPTTDELSYDKYLKLKELAHEMKLKYFNLNYEVEEQIDWTTDTYDGGVHLNIYGAQKVANHICKFLMDNFEIENKKDDIAYKKWNDCLIKYLEITKKK